MKIVKSRSYEIDGSNVSFEFDREDGKIIGVKKQNNIGFFDPVDPKRSEFGDLSQSDEAVNAYNVAKYSSNKRAYVDSIASKTASELESHYNKELSKSNNSQFVDPTENLPSLAFSTPLSTGNSYRKGKGYRSSKVMTYPLDINPTQDHMKIRRYNYLRAQSNSSKPRREVNVGDDTVTVAGDSVVGSDLMGSILLPMPKATDVNGVEWGKSELTSTGLAAMKAAQAVDRRTGSTIAGAMLGGPGGAMVGAGVDASGLTGTMSGISPEEIRKQNAAREGLQFGDYDLTTEMQAAGSGMFTQALSGMAGFLLGTELDSDTFLARTGGRVLNPNAEMLFQGPVIRDFTFSFIMIARSEREGKEIRKIIRFLKMGMAPKFQNQTFLANPDIFLLDYKNGLGKKNVLDTVNRFSPGGLALTTMNVDYAPNGYWSAYQDSQPVAIKMDLNFTELRPLYQGDQDGTPEDSVGL